MPPDAVFEQMFALFGVVEHSLRSRQNQGVIQYQGHYIQFFQAPLVDVPAFFQTPSLLMFSHKLIFLAFQSSHILVVHGLPIRMQGNRVQVVSTQAMIFHKLEDILELQVVIPRVQMKPHAWCSTRTR
jgi:hypothetical protein